MGIKTKIKLTFLVCRKYIIHYTYIKQIKVNMYYLKFSKYLFT